MCQAGGPGETLAAFPGQDVEEEASVTETVHLPHCILPDDTHEALELYVSHQHTLNGDELRKRNRNSTFNRIRLRISS